MYKKNIILATLFIIATGSSIQTEAMSNRPFNGVHMPGMGKTVTLKPVKKATHKQTKNSAENITSEKIEKVSKQTKTKKTKRLISKNPIQFAKAATFGLLGYQFIAKPICKGVFGKPVKPIFKLFDVSLFAGAIATVFHFYNQYRQGALVTAIKETKSYLASRIEQAKTFLENKIEETKNFLSAKHDRTDKKLDTLEKKLNRIDQRTAKTNQYIESITQRNQRRQ